MDDGIYCGHDFIPSNLASLVGVMHAGYWDVACGTVALKVCHLVTHSDHQTTLGVNCLTIPDGFALDSVLLRFEEDT